MPVSFWQLRSGVWAPLVDQGPTAPSMLIGASNDIPSTTESGWTTFEATVPGPQTLRRTFSPESAGVPATWAASPAGTDVGKRGSAWSFKPNLTLMANGGLDTAFRNFILSIPDDHLAMISMWPEADRHVRIATNTQAGVFTAAKWRAAHTRFAQIIREVGKPRVYIYTAHSSWLWYPENTNGPPEEDVWPGDGQVDIHGQDGYGYHTREHPSEIFQGGIDQARAKGVPWGVFETGCYESTSDVNAKATWMHLVADWAAVQGSGGRPGCEVLCWFNSEQGLDPEVGAPTPGSSSQARTAAGQIATTYHRDWTTYSL